jgi:hypothetical protein
VTARVVGVSALSGKSAIPSNGPGLPKQDKPGQLDMGGARGEYLVLPVPRGGLQEARGQSNLTRILSPDGKTLRTLDKLIADVPTGMIEYARDSPG